MLALRRRQHDAINRRRQDHRRHGDGHVLIFTEPAPAVQDQGVDNNGSLLQRCEDEDGEDGEDEQPRKLGESPGLCWLLGSHGGLRW